MGVRTFLLLALVSISTFGLLIDEKKAKTALGSRKLNSGAFNGYWEEWFRSSSMERECLEESCGFEEYLERAENDIPGIRSADVGTLFEQNYYECYQAVVSSRCRRKTEHSRWSRLAPNV